jgi:hypothetical protein
MNKKKILLGPFIGEFAWEFLYFSPFVNYLNKYYFDIFEIHVATFSGRALLYDVSIKMQYHPNWYTDKPISSNSYIADQWINYWPKISNANLYLNDVEKLYKKLYDYHSRQIKYDLILSPSEIFINPIDISNKIGTLIFKNNDDYKKIELKPPKKYQFHIALKESNKGITYMENLLRNGNNKNYISIFPRMRAGRRPDKNWDIDNYRELITTLLLKYDSYDIFIIGAPGGAHFSGECMPAKVYNLINVPDDCRLDIQIAALNRSTIAIGSMSGAIYFANQVGVPLITWGDAIQMMELRLHSDKEKSIHYINNVRPSVAQVMSIVKDVLFDPLNKNKNYDVKLNDYTRIVKYKINEFLKVLELYILRWVYKI